MSRITSSKAGTVNWDSYEIYQPGVNGPLGDLPRKEARGAYDRLMAEREHRIDELRRAVAGDGVDLDSASGLQDLNDWFARSVEPNPSEPGRLANRWYSIVNDIGLHLGETTIRRTGGKLHWEFFTRGKSNPAFQRHVVGGFKAPAFNYDFDMIVAWYGHRIVGNETREIDGTLFVDTVHTAVSNA